MFTITIKDGSRHVIATQNDEKSLWNARLYVNNGETATLVAKKFKSQAGVWKWATEILAKK